MSAAKAKAEELVREIEGLERPDMNQVKSPGPRPGGESLHALLLESSSPLRRAENNPILVPAVVSDPAQQAGLQAGMVIVSANRQAVDSVEKFDSLMEDLVLRDGLLLLVKTPLGSRYVVVSS